MRRALVLCLPLILLALAVPWGFAEDRGGRVFGLPTWAAYSIAAAALFAAAMALLLGKCWELSAGDEDDAPDR